MLKLGGIPLRSEERSPDHPLVMAGGGCCFNAEPLAPFLDLMALGDGEEILPEILERLAKAKGSGLSRSELLRSLARIPRRIRPLPVPGPRPGKTASSPGSGGQADSQATGGGSGQDALPPLSAPALRRRARPVHPGDRPGLHQGLPFLPGGHALPPRARAQSGNPGGPSAPGHCGVRLRRSVLPFPEHRGLHRPDGTLLALHRPVPGRAGGRVPALAPGGLGG